MISTDDYSTSSKQAATRSGEQGAALATAILLLGLMSAIAMTVLAVVSTETRVAGGDLQRTQAFYAAASGIEKMSSDFNTLFARTSRPTQTQLNNIAAAPPDLASEGFAFNQSIVPDDTTLAAMRLTQNITNGSYPTVTVPNGPLVGLTAAVIPYILTTTATSSTAQVNLERRMNNYLVPIFQFGMFSNEDMEIHPGPAFTFNGRVHANGNLYVNGNITFLDKVTTASEVVRDVLRNGATHTGTVTFNSGPLTVGNASVVLGPNLAGSDPTSPDGTRNGSWKSNSVATYGGQLLTSLTGVAPLKLPLQLDGNQPREIIKRRTPNDDVTLSDSRYHSKAEIRILLEDEGSTTDVARSNAAVNGDGTTNAGVNLSTFDPIPLPNTTIAAVADGHWLLASPDTGGTTFSTDSTTCINQEVAAPSPTPTPTPTQAMTVRGVKSTTQSVTLNGTATMIPAGAGITGHILIQIIDSTGVARDVTTQILSMGMTEGEPNGIVYLQRPLWAAYTQGTRDADSVTNGGNSTLKAITDNYWGADGEISSPTQNDPGGYLTGVTNDSSRRRAMTPPAPPSAANSWALNWNSIVPINLYNVREGRINNTLAANTIYERGVTSIVEINMKNLARWVDGVYDANLLASTTAVSTNIGSPDGYIVYISDRRGDKVKSEVDTSNATVSMTNGTCDNEDIYGPNNVLDGGEDVIDFKAKKGTLQKDTTELPDPAALADASTSSSTLAERTTRANTVAAWTNPSNYFRRAVRLFNGENLQTLVGASTSLSTTKGITIASENLVYIWGNYNTQGINAIPAAGTSALNDSTAASHYCPGTGCTSTTDTQVPASIVCDAIFPLSKTWFDSVSAMYPDNQNNRPGDRTLGANVTWETSVRAGIIAGNNLSALSAGASGPDAGNYSTTSDNNESRLNGGMHNFPRFLEDWNDQRFNFVGSLIPLYHSTQAMGQYNANSTFYSPPTRDWAFDVTFRQPNRLPPGTPQFQYIEPTAFRQVLY
jgi:Tfp pilus assembly protein PilX